MERSAYYCVIDFEATCSEDNSVPRHEMEIIEIGAVMVDATTLDAVSEFQSFVKPVIHPRLTKFCTELTSIRQVDVEFSYTLPQVVGKFSAWLKHYPYHLFCSWGDFDKTLLERECANKQAIYPFNHRHWNLKTAYAKNQGMRREFGLASALKQMNIPFQGMHHRGIDDARMIAKLMPYLI